MAAYISFQPSDFFNTVLYTGNASTNAITGVGFQPDMIWIKNRTATGDHSLYDSPRGTTKCLVPNGNDEEQTYATGLTAFGADGFTVGSQAIVNGNTNDIASWNWKAGTTSGLSGGTITPSAYSFNATSGFGAYAFTGNGVSGATIAHGLGTKPGLIIVKEIGTAGAWIVQHQSLGATKCIYLNTTAAADTDSTRWNDTEPTSTLFSLGNDGEVNGNTQTYIAYVWAGTEGFSKFSSYLGNGNADGAFLYTGFRPAYVLVKKTNGTGSWWMFDNKRLGYNPANNRLYADDNAVGATATVIDLVSNGFKFRTTDGDLNGDGNNIIYAAFSEFPIVSSNDVPGVAR